MITVREPIAPSTPHSPVCLSCLVWGPGRYTAYKGDLSPAVPGEYSNREYSYRASIPAFASSIIVRSPAMLPGSSRAALNTRDAIYHERSSLAGGGELELRTYFHRTRRNLIVVDVALDCTNCTASATVSLRAFSRPEQSDVVFHQRGAGHAGGSPRQLLGVLHAPEQCEPSNAEEYDTNHTLGFVHDVCPSSLSATPGAKASVQLLSVLTLSNEETEDQAADAKGAVVQRALSLYTAAKAADPTQLLEEHKAGWAALWSDGGIELETPDLSLQQTTNATLCKTAMLSRFARCPPR